MENQLIQLYVLVCHIHDTQSETCFQRLSNNSNPHFTDQELVTIYLFGHLQGLFEKKAIQMYFHGVRLHAITQRRSGTIPLPKQIWLREGSCHDSTQASENRKSTCPTVHCWGKLTVAAYLLVFTP